MTTIGVGIGIAIALLLTWVASYLPAHRASRVDPVVALRGGGVVGSSDWQRERASSTAANA